MVSLNTTKLETQPKTADDPFGRRVAWIVEKKGPKDDTSSAFKAFIFTANFIARLFPSGVSPPGIA